MASVVAAVTDDQGWLLLIRTTDNDLWALLGGGHEIGESIADTVVREVREETGYNVEVTRVVGLYTNPGHVMAYDDGEVRQQFSICFAADLVGGTATTSSESSSVDWFDSATTETLDLHPSMRIRIEHALSGELQPDVG